MSSAKKKPNIWKGDHRWVCPYYMLDLYERHEPSDDYVSGYAVEQDWTVPWLVVLNDLGGTAWFHISFFNQHGEARLDWHIDGTLEGRQSDRFSPFDNPNFTMKDISGDPSGFRLHTQWGWFHLYASQPLLVSAWHEHYRNPLWETWGQNWTTPLDVVADPSPRVDHFPKVAGRPSIRWKQ